MSKIKRREYLQQAHKYTEDTDISGWYVSEKLDGVRAFWDGGLSRGQKVRDIPYAAKVIPASKEPKKHLDKEATGLWSRYGNPIWAPDFFLNQLPCCMLDGELWMDRGGFQKVTSCVRKEIPGPEWEDVQYMVFGSPNPHCMFSTGHAKSGKNIDLVIDQNDVKQWVKTLNQEVVKDWQVVEGLFIHELGFLQAALESFPDGPAAIHRQTILSANLVMARQQLDEMMDYVVVLGGEGLVVRNPNEPWVPQRVKHILKVKPCYDDEATIVGFTSGEETDKGSKLLGLIGAVILDYKGKEFKLSGFTDSEREFDSEPMRRHAEQNPGARMPEGCQGKHFKVGDQITFKYREFSDDGLPKEARFFRKRELV